MRLGLGPGELPLRNEVVEQHRLGARRLGSSPGTSSTLALPRSMRDCTRSLIFSSSSSYPSSGIVHAAAAIAAAAAEFSYSSKKHSRGAVVGGGGDGAVVPALKYRGGSMSGSSAKSGLPVAATETVVVVVDKAGGVMDAVDEGNDKVGV